MKEALRVLHIHLPLHRFWRLASAEMLPDSNEMPWHFAKGAAADGILSQNACLEDQTAIGKDANASQDM
ncbi:MAG TPA: hypothetical protein VFE62_09185 [Gemmataceae bacterium]|nr:hypothetical protein [Gemmataceae bacterium]